MSELAELFPDGDYRFHLTLRRGDPRAFFAPRDPSGSVLAERRRWIAEAPGRYTGLEPAGVAGFQEFAAWCVEWGARGTDSVAELGGEVEPDFLLLAPDEAGLFRLRGGALCFPTGWALEEKLGHTLDFIHGVVPGLNAALGSPIQSFLQKLKPGVAYLRDNWGIAASAELNLHPSRGIAAPGATANLGQLWLRVEHQALVALPASGSVLFGIRIALHRLDEFVADREVATGLARALATMPSEIAAYKRVGAIRERLSRELLAY